MNATTLQLEYALSELTTPPEVIADLLEHMIVSGKYQGYAMCLCLISDDQSKDPYLRSSSYYMDATKFITSVIKTQPYGTNCMFLHEMLAAQNPEDAGRYQLERVEARGRFDVIMRGSFECRIMCSNWYWDLIRGLRNIAKLQSNEQSNSFDLGI